MSDTSQGPGWWLASDMKWYPPELPPPGYAPMPPSAPERQASEAVKPHRRTVALSLLIGGGVTMVVGFTLFFVVGFASILNSPVYDTPAHVLTDYAPGTYYVYEQTGSQVALPGFSYSHYGLATITADDVQVTRLGAGPLQTWAVDGSNTLTEHGHIYSSVVGFHVPSAGRYSVTVASGTRTAVIIAPSLGGQLVKAAPWLILPGIGFPAGVVGLVLLIVDTNERRRQRRMLEPAGWYAVTAPSAGPGQGAP